jgi:polyisoprenoid-binding protein YceI
MNSLRRLLLPLISIATALSAFAQVETYKIDPSHSSVGFGVRHVFTKVPGIFSKFSGTIVVDRKALDQSKVEAVIEVASINTNEPKRDGHLQGADFFLTNTYPTMTFKSSSWTKTGENTFDVAGDLRIKDVTKSVVLKVSSLGFGPGMNGAQISGWEAKTTLDRRDFGLGYGQGVVGNDVEVVINVEASLVK